MIQFSLKTDVRLLSRCYCHVSVPVEGVRVNTVGVSPSTLRLSVFSARGSL